MKKFLSLAVVLGAMFATVGCGDEKKDSKKDTTTKPDTTKTDTTKKDK